MFVDPRQRWAMALMIVGCVLSVILSALVRRLDISLPPISIAFYRSLFGMVLVLPGVLLSRPNTWGLPRLRFYLTRGTLSAGATLALFYGLKGVPLAAATSLGYAGPVIGAILVPMLVPNSRLSRRHWVAVIVGFLGVLIVMRPNGSGPISFTAAILSSAALLAAYNILIARAGAQDRTIAILLWSGLSSTLLLGTGMLALGLFKLPDVHQLAALSLVAVVAVLANLAVAAAYRIGHPGLLMPLAYLGLPFAAILGVAFMNEAVSLWTVLGGLVIIGAALWGSGRNWIEQPQRELVS
jgi:drug/metabolite transporter (DMT)-like permease